jgi:hypothetical protein
MNKYIDADKLTKAIEDKGLDCSFALKMERLDILALIDSLQQDEKAVELEMCSQAYWEERGWMMIPPDVTLKGIESLLERVRKKLQQEQPQVADASKMEQVEVDLERETVLNYAHEHYYYDKDFDGYGHGKFRPVFTRDDLIGFARHFYELGLNARKEDK